MNPGPEPVEARLAAVDAETLRRLRHVAAQSQREGQGKLEDGARGAPAFLKPDRAILRLVPGYGAGEIHRREPVHVWVHDQRATHGRPGRIRRWAGRSRAG